MNFLVLRDYLLNNLIIQPFAILRQTVIGEQKWILFVIHKHTHTQKQTVVVIVCERKKSQKWNQKFSPTEGFGFFMNFYSFENIYQPNKRRIQSFERIFFSGRKTLIFAWLFLEKRDRFSVLTINSKKKKKKRSSLYRKEMKLFLSISGENIFLPNPTQEK